MSIPLPSDNLGSILGGNSFRYDLRQEDLLWAGRMLLGEEGSNSTNLKYAAVLWCMTSRLVTTRAVYHTYEDLIRAYSQPLFRTRMTERAQQIQNTPWEQLPEKIQNIVVKWAKGQIHNPIPRAIHFAVPSVSSNNRGADGLQSRGLELLWDSLGRTADSVADGGNAYYVTIQGSNTKRWPDNYVRISLNQNLTEDSSPEEVNQQNPTPGRQNASNGQSNQPENNIFERNSTITVNRTSPSNVQYPYFVVASASTFDPQSSLSITEQQREMLIETNNERFFNQFQALKDSETIENAQVVPVIEVHMEDDAGNIVSLNELIFSRSPLHNYFRVLAEDPTEITQDFPDRALASIESFSVKTEPPSVGGPVGISVAHLTLKVHNLSLVRRSHPLGKYIAFLMIPGIYVRIKYGMNPLNFQDVEFQWKEEDFFVAQHDVAIDTDKTATVNITLMPAAQKLFNQIHIGESIPFSDLAANHQALTDDDIENVLQSIVEPGTTQDQLNQMRDRLSQFKNQFNSGQPSAGFRVVRRSDSTLGSVLQGAISNSRILEQPEGPQSVPVENMVDALRSVQSILLTRRFQSLLQQDAYRTTLKGVQRNVINLGPLIHNLVLPEMRSIALYVSQNHLKMGAEFSTEATEDEGTSERRSNVKLIFENFNARAGQYANRPISVFPIDVDAIFAYLRQERDVGQFSSTINAFVSRINEILNEPVNFDVVRQSSDNGDEQFVLAIPQVKYLFYADPTDATSWILLFYDAKTPIVRFNDLIGRLSRTATDGPIPKQDLVEQLNALRIPFIEMGEEGSFVKSLNASTTADDLLLTHNMILANQQSFGVRSIDGSPQILAGISRELLPGAQNNSQQVIRATAYIVPVEVTLTTFCIVSAILFAPIYIFFPIKAYESLYMPYVIEHEIKNGSAQTRFVLNIQMTQANRITQ